MKVYDIGAHIGTFSLSAISKINKSAGEVICVEADEDAAKLLKRNVSRFSNVKVIQAAVSDSNEVRAPIVKNGNTGATTWVQAVTRRSDGSKFNCVTLDQLIKAYGKPDYVKLDIEGMEVRALGPSEMIRASRPIIYVEVNRSQLSVEGNSVRELEQYLKNLDYVFFTNTGMRNGPIDAFRITEIPTLATSRELFDVLCVQASHQKTNLLRASATSAAS
jgi:FkbM family methyltransferase